MTLNDNEWIRIIFLVTGWQFLSGCYEYHIDWPEKKRFPLLDPSISTDNVTTIFLNHSLPLQNMYSSLKERVYVREKQYERIVALSYRKNIISFSFSSFTWSTGKRNRKQSVNRKKHIRIEIVIFISLSGLFNWRRAQRVIIGLIFNWEMMNWNMLRERHKIDTVNCAW